MKHIDITIIYKDGEILGAYHSFERAMKELITDIQSVCLERTTASIEAELDEEGSVDGYWYYDIIKVDMEGDD